MKKFLIAAALLASASPALADDFIEKIGPTKLAVFTAFNAGEKLATKRCLDKGVCEEKGFGVSAAFGKRPSDLELGAAFIADELIYIGGSIIFGETFGYDSAGIKTFQVGMIGMHGIIFGMNIKIGNKDRR